MDLEEIYKEFVKATATLEALTVPDDYQAQFEILMGELRDFMKGLQANRDDQYLIEIFDSVSKSQDCL